MEFRAPNSCERAFELFNQDASSLWSKSVSYVTDVRVVQCRSRNLIEILGRADHSPNKGDDAWYSFKSEKLSLKGPETSSRNLSYSAMKNS